MSFYPELKTWIESHGGYVNAALTFSNGGSGSNHDSRGIIALQPIAEGTLLVRVPQHLVLDGEALPVEVPISPPRVGEVSASNEHDKNSPDNTGRGAAPISVSPWLRCLAALVSASKMANERRHHNNTSRTGTESSAAAAVDFHVYLASLPTAYETLLDWTEEDLARLKGTTLGEMAMHDRRADTLRTRFDSSVRPALANLLGPNVEEWTYDDFVRATKCIATRGFHMSSPSSAGCGGQCSSHIGMGCCSERRQKKEGPPSYCGPYLIPFIDLLNHDPHPLRKCTTLRQDPTDRSFYMISERAIAGGDEILHSYGRNLTSADLLQTFGFVHRDSVVASAAASLKRRRSGEEREESHMTGPSTLTPSNITLATVSRSLLINNCREVAFRRGFVECLRENIQTASKTRSSSPCDVAEDDGVEQDEVWDPTVCWDEKVRLLVSGEREDSIVPDEILIDVQNPLNAHVVTCCVILLLPREAFVEFQQGPSLLDESILDDPFLGILACRALVRTVDARLVQYGGATCDEDERLLCNLLRSSTTKSISRQMAALTVVIEEKKSLQVLREEVVERLDMLGVGADVENIIRSAMIDNK